MSPSSAARFLLAVVLGLAGAWVPAAAAQATQGPPTRSEPTVVSIRIEGRHRQSQERILDALGQRVGEPFDDEGVQRGVRRLWDLYRIRAETRYREVEGGIELLVVVREIPVDFEPRFIGNSDVSEEELREWGGLEPGEEIYFNEAQAIARRLRDEYRREGYHFAEVEVVMREPDDEADVAPDLIYDIREGPEVSVADVVIHGNESMPDGGILFWRTGLRASADLELGPPILGIFWDDFVEEELEADLQAMREVYRREGWLDAVVELDHLEFNEERDEVVIHVQVDEGPRYTVSSLTIEAVSLEIIDDGRRVRIDPAELEFPEDELLELCELGPGLPYRQELVSRDRVALRNYYGERGRIDHESLPVDQRFQFRDPEVVFDVEAKEVQVIYRLAQGRRQFLREILFSGAHSTRDAVLRRLVTVFPGEQADLPEIVRSLQRIRGTGYFLDQLNPAHPDPTFRFLETGDPAWKDLLFEVDEGAPLSFTFGGGLSSYTGVFGQVDLQINNFDVSRWPRSLWSTFQDVSNKEAFHGKGQTLLIRARPGDQRSDFQLRFTEPDIFGRHLERIGMTVEALKSLRVERSHDEDSDELGLRLSRQVGPDSSVYLGYRYAQVFVDDLSPGGEPALSNPLTVPALLKAQEGDSSVSRVELGWALNTTDHPLDPRRGERVSLRARVYDRNLGADFDFVRAVFQGDFYQPLGGEERQTGPLLNYGFQAGTSWTYGDTPNVPYTERFFLGGRSLRGFRRRGVGPNENGFTRGGASVLSGSLELRFPLITQTLPGTTRQTETLRGFVFLDGGILGEEDANLDFDDLRWSTGFGVGLNVGPLPLVLTFGFPQRTGPGDIERTFQFSIGF